MRFKLAILGALSMAVFSMPTGSSAYDFVLWLQGSNAVATASRALNQGDVARAIRLTRKALEEDLTFDDTFRAYNNLCVAYADLNLFDIALDYCDRALGLKNDWRALNNRANAKLGLGKIDDAIDDYETALSMKPDANVLKGNLELALERKRLGVPAPNPGRRGA